MFDLFLLSVEYTTNITLYPYLFYLWGEYVMLPMKAIEMNIAMVHCFSELTISQFEYIKRTLPLRKQVLFSKYYRTYTNIDFVKSMLPKDKRPEFDLLYKTLSLRETLKKLGYDKYEQYPESMETEILGYRMKEDYSDQLYARKYANFSDLIESLISVLTITTSATLLPTSTLFSHIVNTLEMHAMQFYTIPPRGKPDKRKKMLGKNVPDKSIIFPTDINTEGVSYLIIPAKLVQAYKITGSSKFYFGINYDRTDTLFFFPEETCSFSQFTKGHITSVQPSQETKVLEDIFDCDPEFINTIRTKDVVIWHEPVQVDFRGAGAYLKVPKPFLEKSAVETLYYQEYKKNPTKPAFVLTYDLVGNLVYHKILFLQKIHHDNSMYSVVLLGDIPSQVDDLNDQELIDGLDFVQTYNYNFVEEENDF